MVEERGEIAMNMDMSRPATPEELAELMDSPKYRPWNLAEYRFWVVRLNSKDQGLPGRVIVWLKHHDDKMDAWELDPPELLEFTYTILPALDKAIRGIGWPLERLNHEWLGNEVSSHRGHGHYHVTPRYHAPIQLSTRSFVDEDCNARRRTPKLVLPEFELIRIRDLFRSQLGFAG